MESQCPTALTPFVAGAQLAMLAAVHAPCACLQLFAFLLHLQIVLLKSIVA